jgi:GNAT superfamily N-acetyltransferase
MDSADIPAALELCRAANWNQIAADWALYLEHSSGGARVLLYNGQLVGTVTAVDYQQRFSWIGMVLVDERMRRQGIGTRLLSLALEHLRISETVKLDATPAGRPVYLPLGFVDEWGLIRMETIAVPVFVRNQINVRTMGPEDRARVMEWDMKVFGADRSPILWHYRDLAPDYAWVAERDGRLAGYSFGRHGFRWDQAGPVVAESRDAAQALLAATLTGHPGRPFLVDSRLADPDWINWLRGIGFVEQRPYMRMYRGPNRFPGLPEAQFAILGPELG